jgi:hypothetical protein
MHEIRGWDVPERYGRRLLLRGALVVLVVLAVGGAIGLLAGVRSIEALLGALTAGLRR